MKIQQLKQYAKMVEKEVQEVDGQYLVNVQNRDGSLLLLRFSSRREASLFITAVNAGFDRAFC